MKYSINKATVYPAIYHKMIALTFDDGPGPHTLELAEYLHEEGIMARFFCLGRHVKERPDVVRAMHAMGHSIGSHSYDHMKLTLCDDAAAIKASVLEGDRIIREVLELSPAAPVHFRAPHGLWNEKVAQNFVDIDCNIVGPIGWDLPLNMGDWWMWKHFYKPKEVAEKLFKEIDFMKGGMICLHDSNAERALGDVNCTFEMIPILVPMLKAAGYDFLRFNP